MEIENLRKQYYEALLNLHNKQDIIDAMPKPEYENFFPIIYGLIELIEKNIIELEIELTNLSLIEEEMKEYFKEEIEDLQFKKETCEKLIKQANETKEIETKSNSLNKKNLIFATTNSGNVYIEKDLKDIPEEYYSEVETSLIQLEEGFEEDNIQKGRIIQNNAKLSGLHEIKPFKIRVFYKNLSPDTIYILMVRMKKSDNNQLDREEAIIRNKQTIKEYEQLKENIKIPNLKEQIIKQNQETKEKIFGNIAKNRRG